jgi:hypothetical protein
MQIKDKERKDMTGGLRSEQRARRHSGIAAKSERPVAAWMEKIKHRTEIHRMTG